jgi:hypothetical protein
VGLREILAAKLGIVKYGVKFSKKTGKIVSYKIDVKKFCQNFYDGLKIGRRE